MNKHFRASFPIRAAFLLVVTLSITIPTVAIRARGAYGPVATSVALPIPDAPVTIPFELVTRHIMLKVRINNSRPLSFVFDTGDKVGIVDTEVAKELGLKMEGQLRIGGAGADTLPASFIKDATWSLPGLDGFTQPVALSMP